MASRSQKKLQGKREKHQELLYSGKHPKPMPSGSFNRHFGGLFR